MDQIEFRSDNAVGVAPEILDALASANVGSVVAYGADEWTERLTGVVRERFEHSDAEVFPVVSGTAANALALSAMCPPWGSVLCHGSAHILENEGGATSMFGAGVVMTPVPGPSLKIQPDALEEMLAGFGWKDPHHSQPTVLSLTTPSEMGVVYDPKEVTELSEISARWGLKTHLDGARIANALVALDCSPADLTWRAGVDVLTLGATKNGSLSTDAIVSFDPQVSEELVYRTKRSGHVASKMRFQSAQLIAYLTDELWLRLAARANSAMTRLAAGLTELPIEFVNEPDANILFLQTTEEIMRGLEEAGLAFYRIGGDEIRLVTSFVSTDEDMDEALVRFRQVLGG